MWQLLNAFFAEQQAIAIYEAQVFWRPGESGLVFREILAEERAHRLSLEPFLGEHKSMKILVMLLRPFNVLAGWGFGSVLSMLPRKICYRAHVWAEEDAAKTYDDTAKKIPLDAPRTLHESLIHAATQERTHARIFEDLLKDLS